MINKAILRVIAIALTTLALRAYAASITIDDLTDKPTIAREGFATWASGTSSPGGSEVIGFVGIYQTTLLDTSSGFSSGLTILTEPGTGAGPNAVISDILAYVIGPQALGGRGVLGAFLSDGENNPHTVAQLSTLLGLIPLAHFALPDNPSVIEETGDPQTIDTGKGLTFTLTSDVDKVRADLEAVPDGGATVFLLGLGMATTAVLSRKLRRA